MPRDGKYLHDPGLYRGEIIDQSLTKSKDKGTPGIFITVVVYAKLFKNEPVLIPEDQQKEGIIKMWITKKTVDFVVRDLRAMGFTGNEWSQINLTRAGHQDLRGKDIKLLCRHEYWQDEPRERWHLARYDSNAAQLDDKESDYLQAMFGKVLKSAPKPAPKPAKINVQKPVKEVEMDNVLAKAAKADEEEEDDIPF